MKEKAYLNYPNPIRLSVSQLKSLWEWYGRIQEVIVFICNCLENLESETDFISLIMIRLISVLLNTNYLMLLTELALEWILDFVIENMN